MTQSLRMAHLVVGAIAVIAFLITGQIMGRHEPPVAAMEWAERLLFRSRHIYLLSAGLVNLAMGVRFALPELGLVRGAAISGSLLVLASAVLTFFAFFAEPMAHRLPGMISALGLYALFGGVLLHVLVNLLRSGRNTA